MTDLTPYTGDEFEKNPKAKEALDQMGEVFRKNLYSLIPGGGIIEDILNFQSDLKTKKSISFLERFIVKLEIEFGSDFSKEDLKNESFSALLNRVLQHIQNTTSNYKKERFRDILLLKYRTQSNDLLFEKFVDLLDRVNDIQIILLSEMVKGERFKLGAKSHKGTEMIKSYSRKAKQKNSDNDFLLHLKNYTSDQKSGELEFYILELASLGLVKLIPRGSSKRANTPGYMATTIGAKFLSFVINE